MWQMALEKEDVSRLWAAVLLQACKDIVSPFDHKVNSRRAIRRKALSWVLSTRNDATSFISVCGYLGFDPDHVREIMLRLPQDVQTNNVRLNSFLAAGDFSG